ncbi:MAG TPA: signal peptide peptidase SppA [Polyangiales bacterium]|nr:signal peptide peptidase SppA [Polyangiales bacterium]
MRLRIAVLVSAAWLVTSLASRPTAHAQLHRITDAITTPASTLVLQDDAAALDVNPAASGFMPALGFTYVHARVDERAGFLGRGDAAFFAAPLLFGFSASATVQSIRPGDLAARTGDRPRDRAVLGLGLAYNYNKRLAIGVSGRTFSAGDPALDGLSTVDAGLQWHATNWLGFSLVGRDLLASRSGFGTNELDLHASLLGGFQLRPFGNRDVVLDFDVALGGRRRVGGRVGLGVQIPYFGYAASVVELERIGKSDEVYRVLAELGASFEGLSVGGGVVMGDGFGAAPGGYGVARFEARTRPGVLLRARVLDVEVGAVDERGMLRVLMTLEAALRDQRVAGVLLRPRGASLPSAYAQELRLLISSLRAAGKRVVCHLEDATGSQFYACAAADSVLMDPAGSIRLLGSSTEALLFGDTIRSLGLRADFIRIGDYKSAPEQFTQSKMSEEAREQVRSLFTDVHTRVRHDLASDLHVTPERISEVMANGPHLAHQAIADKLIERAQDEVVLRSNDDAAFEGRSVVTRLGARTRTDWFAGPNIGVVVIDGSIIDGESLDVPLLGIHMTGGRTAVRAIESMRADPLVRAIVLRVDSPGGAVVASDQIWRAVRRARAVKPVIVSMGAVAASGGYYVASAGDEIWADPATITGSIGIFYGKVDAAGLAEKLGVGVEQFSLSKRAGGESLFRAFTADERSALSDRLRTYYRLFLRRVAKGRGVTVEQVDALGRGRVYSGDAALRVGLVDHLGGFASALMRARELGRVSESAELVVLPKRPEGLFEYVFGDLPGASLEANEPEGLKTLPLPHALRSTLAHAFTVLQLGAAQPLALMPLEIEF